MQIGEKPPERSWYRHKDKSKHHVKGWVRLASFMPVATLLGPCEFAQDRITLASREKVLQSDDATKPTGVFPEGEFCNIWFDFESYSSSSSSSSSSASARRERRDRKAN
eukprot:g63261.t1